MDYGVDDLLLLMSFGGTNYTQDLTDTLALSDDLTTKYLDIGLPETLSLSDSLLTPLVIPVAPASSVTLSDALQRAVTRHSSTTPLDWRNPPRLAQTLWTLAGTTCPCGLGHVGPQGCNAEMSSDIDESISLSDDLTVSLQSEGTRLLTWGAEEGQVASMVAASAFTSYVFSPVSPYITIKNNIQTDQTHAGTYSIQVGSASGTNSLDGFTKTIAGSLSHPFDISFKYYFRIKASSSASFPFEIVRLNGTGGQYFGVGPMKDPTLHLAVKCSQVSSGTTQQEGSTTLSLDTWYRVVGRLVTSGSTVTATAKLYSNNSTTVLETITLTNANWTGTTISSIEIGNVFDTHTGWDIYLDDVVVETGEMSPRPVGFALMIPNSDVSTSWTRGGSSPAASNAGNVGILPTPTDTSLTNKNTVTATGSTDRFGVSVAGVPTDKGYSYLHVYMRCTGVDATSSLKMAIWDDVGNQTLSPEITATDGGGLVIRTDDLVRVDIRGKTWAQLGQYNIGYVSTGVGTGTRTVHNIWGLVEYDPT